jgi:predicted transposase YbfD/YdcC
MHRFSVWVLSLIVATVAVTGAVGQQQLQPSWSLTFRYGFADMACRHHETRERAHGRNEERHYYQMKVPVDLPGRDEWLGLKTIGLVLKVTETNGKKTEEIRYYLSSLPLGVKRFAEAARGHWRIENSLHWT